MRSSTPRWARRSRKSGARRRRRSTADGGAAQLTYFAGRWRFERAVEPQGARMTGEARVTDAGDGSLAYHEQGQLVLADGRSFAAERRYRFRTSGEAVAIDFADGMTPGARFVTLAFAPADDGLRARDTHPCGPDLYEVVYTIADADRFATDIAVRGPRNAYRATTRFRRVG